MASTSTAESSAAKVLDEIQALFNWNPPPLKLLERQTRRSTTSRGPSFYDRHLSDNLVLKRVVRFPSLVTQLATNVDDALAAASKTLPQTLGYFVTADERKLNKERLNTSVEDEKEVANFYDRTTGTYCACVASALALHPTASFSEWRSLLLWTQSPRFSGYAIADGILCFMPEKDDTEKVAAIAKTIESKYHSIFLEMRKNKHPFVTWEIKSLSVGSPGVMIEVPNMGKFSWTTCDDDNCNALHRRARKQAKETLIGPDALDPPWRLPDDPLHSDEETDIQPLTSHATLQQPVTGRVTRSAGRSLRSSTRPPPPPSTSEGEPSTKDKGKRRKLDEEDEDEEDHKPPTKGKGKRRKRNEEEEDKAYVDRPGLTAQNLVQQAWAQAVQVDGTVIVLHSGNYELVCVRHRATQTLYVSDIIEPPLCANPGYGKLHIGIYIAAIQETFDRKLQPKPQLPGDGSNDLIGGDQDQDRNQGSGSNRKDRRGYRGGGPRGGRKMGRSGRLRGSAGRSGPTDHEQLPIEKAIHVANKRDVVFLYLQYGIYDSPVPASFLRSAHPIMSRTRCPTSPYSPRAIRSYGAEECLTIVLTSEIGRGATGVVHRGSLKLDLQNVTMALDVVVKLAFDTEQRDALRNEYEIYRHLRSKGVYRGTATILGIFDDCEGAACALVMLYAGVPLCEESQGNLSISDCKSALSILKSIHCADILHGDI
ncbi:hypothetical protein APHAL10511_004974, partial [Amanita phalloides]